MPLIDEFNNLMKQFNVEKLNSVATDGLSTILRESVNDLVVLMCYNIMIRNPGLEILLKLIMFKLQPAYSLMKLL